MAPAESAAVGEPTNAGDLLGIRVNQVEGSGASGWNQNFVQSRGKSEIVESDSSFALWEGYWNQSFASRADRIGRPRQDRYDGSQYYEEAPKTATQRAFPNLRSAKLRRCKSHRTLLDE